MWQFNSTVAFFLSSIGFYLYDTVNDGRLTVETSYGNIEGLNSVSRNGREYYQFLKIPYAKPPIGDLRFASPELPEPWNGTRDGTYMGSSCLQMDLVLKNRQGSEDCLYLNVFTHQIQNKKTDVPLIDLHPVILFIHGGGFMFGSAEVYRPKYFMDEDIVLITINYRLASFGFLNIGHKDASGNMGLKDQIMALKWVQENIHSFGGDKNRVTLMGESAGAASAHLHMLSNRSKGLFHRVIGQSGTALAPWALISKPVKQAQDFAAKLNCRRKSATETVACLRQLDGNLIIEAHRDATLILHNPLAMFGPTIETIKDSDTFLSDHPMNLIKANATARVPWILGVNSEEGLIFSAPILNNERARNQLNRNWTHWAPQLLGYEFEPKARKDEISRRIWNFYFGHSKNGISIENLENVTNLMSDRHFFANLHCVVNLNQDDNESSRPPLFLYYNTYQSKFSLAKLIFGMTNDLPVFMDIALTTGVHWWSTNILGREEKDYGTCHGDELFLMFNIPYQTEHKRGTRDYEMSKTFIELWSSFARDGEPKHVENYQWPPVTTNKEENCAPDRDSSSPYEPKLLRIQYMKLDATKGFGLIDEPFTERIKFWNSLNFST